MNKNVSNLFEIAKKESRHIIGLMSGTSLDGLDIAFCEVFGSGSDTKINLKKFETIAYPDQFKEKIRKVFAKETIDFQYLTVLNEYIGSYHAQLINQFLDKHSLQKSEVDLIASHGQTVFHAPKLLHQLEEFSNATLQIGDGDHIAVKTGIITVSDFRQKHIAAGGEGAPLAVYGDFLIFSKKGENRIMLNIGGIGNFTFLPGSSSAEEVFVTDTGPGNTLIDAFTRLYFPEKSFDKNAELALKGTVNQQLLTELKSHAFFNQTMPKTTGPELFNINFVRNAQDITITNDLNPFDLLATLTRFTAETIAETIEQAVYQSENYTLYLSGGGMHNPLIIKWLRELLPSFTIGKSDDLGIDGNAKEAILFAILANETIAGNSTFFGDRLAIPSVSFGKISFPN
ncbi:MAG: anhydro-N-acetylmuramic acid kinase [Bacteroidota bacterium]